MTAAANTWSGKRLGMIGAGNMAEALVRGVTAFGLLPASMIEAYDPLSKRRDLLASLGCGVSDTPEKAAASDVVLFAVKPETVRAAASVVRQHLRPGALVISIAAGVPLRVLASQLPEGSRLIRVMPNTPLLVGYGMSALARGPGVDDANFRLAQSLFSSAGNAVEVDESLLDAVTALSGSGPAYLFRFAEALEAGGVALGLGPELARTLTATTLRGAAEMLVRGGDPAELRQNVTSPGGTTAAALEALDGGGFAGLVSKALLAAKRRGEELGRDA